MYDAAGAEVWSARIDTYGNLTDVTGTKQACPFRWPVSVRSSASCERATRSVMLARDV